jgi:hypothetical protein
MRFTCRDSPSIAKGGASTIEDAPLPLLAHNVPSSLLTMSRSASSLNQRWPSTCPSRLFAGLPPRRPARSPSIGEVGRETGLLAKRILDGERLLPLNPVPIERFKITVNLKTARFLGISFPKELTSLIDETY